MEGLGDEGTGIRGSLPDYDAEDADSFIEEIPLASRRLYCSLERRFKAEKPADIDERKEKEIMQLMRMALQPDAEERASTSQFLDHAWFRAQVVVGGHNTGGRLTIKPAKSSNTRRPSAFST